MSKELCRRISAMRNEEIKKATDRILEDPDADISNSFRRVESYSTLLSLIGPTPLRERILAVAVAFLCILFAGLAWTLRVAETKIMLHITSESVSLQLVEPFSWNGYLPLDMGIGRIGGLIGANAPFLGLAVESNEGDAWVKVDGGNVSLTHLNLGNGGFLKVVNNANQNAFSIFASGKELDGALQIMGETRLTAGREMAGTNLEKEIDIMIPETIDFHAKGGSVVPTQFRARPGEAWNIQNLKVNGIVFSQETQDIPGEVAFVSTIKKGNLTVLGANNQAIALREGDRLTLKGVEGRVVDLQGGDEVKVIFEGSAKKIKVGSKGFEQNAMPTYLEYYYHNQRLTFLWSAVVFFWGILWSIRRTVFA